MIGKTIGHFRIESALGSGGMGDVYAAEDTLLHRTVALKVLPFFRASSPEARARFHREAEAVATIHHPNIVTIYEIGEHEGTPYIAMEYVQGDSLTDWITGDESSIDRILDVILGIAEGLGRAHRAGVVHRDLKPSNVLIDEDGCARIVDFGIAQVADHEGLTQSGTIIGTLAYMSPEQIQGLPADGRTDIWSCGVMLYELLTGRRPFAGERAAALTYEICNQIPHPIDRYNARVPADLQQVTHRCLAKDPDERYQTAADLAASLRSIQRSRSGTSTITGAIARAPRSKRTGRMPIVAGVAVTIAVLIGAYFGFYSSSLFDQGADSVPENSLVVLPFKNLGSPDHEYFADGLTDELSALIGSLGDMIVISHSSAMKYKTSDLDAYGIGQQLNVAYVLEGTVRWQSGADSDRVKVTPRLVRTSDNIQIWSGIYERTLADIFAIQADIADSVSTALDVILGVPDRARLTDQPTANPQAYRAYLHANDYFNRGFSKSNLNHAVRLYEQAIDTDPAFALAYARKSQAHAKMYWFGYDATPERLAMSRMAAQSALSLDPDLPEAHVAWGYYYYWGLRDYDRALAEFRLADRARPSASALKAAIAYVLRRQGKFEEALDQLKLASRLDPRDEEKLYEIGNTYYRLRVWDEARTYLERCEVLAEEWAPPYSKLARLWVHAHGRLDSARSVLVEAGSHLEPVALAEDWVWLELLEGDFAQALSHCEDIDDSVLSHLEKGRILRLMGNTVSAEPHLNSARTSLEALVRDEPEDANLRRYLGLCYALLGLGDSAIVQGQRALEFIPLDRDHFFGGPTGIESMAQIYATLGRVGDAVSQLKILLNTPAGLITKAYLNLSPEYRDIADDPGFRALLRESGDES